MALTEEQKIRMEQKKAEALAKRLKASQTSQPGNAMGGGQQPKPFSSTSTSQQNSSTTSYQGNGGSFGGKSSNSTWSGGGGGGSKPTNNFQETNKNFQLSSKSFYSKTSTQSHPFQKSSSGASNSQFKGQNSSQITAFVSQKSFGAAASNSKPMFGVRTVTGTCSLAARDRFDVHVGYHEGLINTFKSIPSKLYNAVDKVWSFHISDHDKLMQACAPLKPGVEVTPLPRWILETFRRPKEYKPEAVDLRCIEETVLGALMPFQKEGVQYGVSRRGRVLIADDMGLGKTVQALALASYYKDSWPFLIVSPSSMRYSWVGSITRWLPSIGGQSNISVITSGKDFIGDSTVFVISYDLLTKKLKDLQKKNFKLIIMDESHFIKSDKSARTKAAEPLMKACNQLILLSGTPALSRPIELFSQVSALDPRIFKYAKEFGFRYCDGKVKLFGTKEVHDFSGSSNMKELSLLLQERCMIRRLKSEVLQQLPSKQRTMVLLDPSSINTSTKTMKEKEKKAHQVSLGGMEKRGALLEWYAETAKAKVDGVKDYIKDLLSDGEKKFIVFCHHQVMLSGVAELMEANKTGFMVIDGSTPTEARNQNVIRFQTSDKCRVAILSITAANSGLTLTAAQLVVFTEIYWNPGILIQAEDRAHRIGQTDCVTVQYLVARGTADDELWPMIQKKLDVLNKAGLSKDNFEESNSKQLLPKSQASLDKFLSPQPSPVQNKENQNNQNVREEDDFLDMFEDDFDEGDFFNLDDTSSEPDSKRLKVT